MKIFISNYSGNVGKTTIASQFLAPLTGAPLVLIEDQNSTGTASGEKLSGADISKLLEHVLLSDNIIVDCGASNIKEFLDASAKYGNVLSEFDTFIIPTTCDEKQVMDTVKTVETLTRLSVPEDRIRVIINRVENAKVAGEVRETISEESGLDKGCIVALSESEAFTKVPPGETLVSYAADQTDYLTQAKEEKNTKQRMSLLRKDIERRAARETVKQFKSAFQELALEA